MNNKFRLHNFRVFDDKGAEFEIAPITVLTGCNSSGKSSVFKSLMLLQESFEKFRNNYLNGNPTFLNQIELQFNKGKHNLGTFSSTVSKLSNSSEMVFNYSLFSNFLNDSVAVEIVFKKNENSFLKNANLKSVKLSKEGTELMFIELVNDDFKYRINAIAVKREFFDFTERLELYNTILEKMGRSEEFSEWKYLRPEFYNSNEIPFFSEIESIIHAKESLIKRDEVNKLFENINNINTRQKLLFYLPILEVFGDVGKEEFSDLIFNKIIELKDNPDKSRSFDFRDFKAIEPILKEAIKEFEESNCSNFKEFFQKKEDEFLIEYSSKMENANSRIFSMLTDNKSFINVILKNFTTDEPPHWVNHSLLNYGSFAQMKKLESYYYVSAILHEFTGIDYSDQRIDEDIINDEGSQLYLKYIIPKEINVAKYFLAALIQESLIIRTSFFTDITFIDAVRANIQRMYTFKSQGTEFNELIQSYLANMNLSSTSFETGDFIKKWLRKFEIGDDISFELTDDGLGVHIYLLKGDERILLADEGYGITQLLSILLHIELKTKNKTYKYSHPLVNGEQVKYYESTISLEEPETNLHPKFQSLLAEMFVDAYKTYNIRFIIETHSEYLIRKLQTLVAKKELKPDDVALHYIYHHDDAKRPAGKPQVLNIKINEDGSLTDEFGTGFFDEATNWKVELIRLKNAQKN